MSRSILLIDDDPHVLTALATFLEHRGWSVTRALDGRTGVELYERDAPDLVLTDLEMPGLTGLQVVDVLRSRDPEAVVVLLTGHGDIASAVEALKLGAEDFLTKPVDYGHLEVVIGRARERAALRRRVARDDALADAAPFGDLDGTPEMRRLGEQLKLLAAGSTTVLLGGETGTGKGRIARLLHAHSSRARAPFVEVNCAGLSATSLDSELFGHEQGAFPDARQTKRGLLEVADGGTLFLDEIGDLALELQPKLLTVLERQSFRRVGGTRELSVDVRLIAATNIDLREAVRARRFREDLYYRLAVVPLELPSLRARGAQEIARLARALLDDPRRRPHGGPARIAPDALVALTRYAWPGNVRELRNVLERIRLLAPRAEAVELVHLPPEIHAARAPDASRDPAGDLSIAAVERAHILRVLALADYNKTRAARTLGITRATLYAKLAEYGLAALALGRSPPATEAPSPHDRDGPPADGGPGGREAQQRRR